MKRFKSTISMGLVMAVVLVLLGLGSFTPMSSPAMATDGAQPPTPIEMPIDTTSPPQVSVTNPSPLGGLIEVAFSVIGAVI